MLVQYDEEVDSAYLEFSKKAPSRGREVGDNIVLHLSADDELVGIEIFHVSQNFDARNLLTLKVA